jgi:hypothetical protein
MIGLFTIAPNDQSVYYLMQIFGVMGDVFPPLQVKPGDAPTSVPLLLGAMFKTINTMFLTVGAIVVVYITVVGVIKTASEGEFLGKHWDKTWVPLRTVFGIAALFPTSNGYSMIQVGIMWLIIQGVGAADTLWTTVLNYVQIAGSPTAGIQIPTAAITSSMSTLFSTLTCQASAHGRYPNTYTTTSGNHSYYYCKDKPNDPFCGKPNADLWNVNVTGQYSYPIGPSGACGKLQYCDPVSDCKKYAPGGSGSGNIITGDSVTANSFSYQLCQTACKAQQQVLVQIVPVLGQIAQQFVQADNDYITFYNTIQNPAQPFPITPWIQNYCASNNIPLADCCRKESVAINVIFGSALSTKECGGISKFPDINLVNGSVIDYGNPSNEAVDSLYLPYALTSTVGNSDFVGVNVNYYISSIVGAVLTFIQNQPASTLTGWEKDAQDTGWALAGGYYYKMAQMSGSNLNAAIPSLNITGNNPPPLKSSSGDIYRNNYISANELITNLQKQSQADSNFGVSVPSQLAGISSAIGSSEKDVMNNFMRNLSSGGSQPIVQISQMGYGFLITAQVLFAILSVLAFISGWAGSIAVWVLGSGVQTGIGTGFLALFIFLMPAFMALEAALFGIGATLAIYVPLIPYMIFTIGVIGWLIAAIEAIVAGPLIALGILAPGGQHPVLGRADPAVMMLFNLILRPSLMVFGMMASMLLSVVVVKMINSGFGAVMTNIIPAPGLIELILFMVAYTMLIVTALNKCFSLIYHVPDRVLTWIGGHHATYGEEQALGGVKGGVESGASRVSGATGEQQKATEAHGKSAQQRAEKTKDAQDAEVKGKKSEKEPPT